MSGSRQVRKFGEMFKRYGPVLTGVHVTTSLGWYGGMFLAVHNGLDVAGLLEWVNGLGFQCPEWASGMFGGAGEGAAGGGGKGAATDGPVGPVSGDGTGVGGPATVPASAEEAPAGDASDLVTSSTARGVSEAALAYAGYKVLTPIRWPTTFALTPAVARLLNTTPTPGSGGDDSDDANGDSKP